MKTTSLIALSAILGTCAFAQEGPARPDRPQRPPGQRTPSPEMLKEYDTDKDGKLNDEERAEMMKKMRAQMEARQKAMLEKYDANKDGKLDEAETKAAREGQQKEMLEKYDANKDGKLDDEERAKIPANERMMGGRMGGRQGGQPGGRGGRPGGPPPATEAPAKEAPPATETK